MLIIKFKIINLKNLNFHLMYKKNQTQIIKWMNSKLILNFKKSQMLIISLIIINSKNLNFLLKCKKSQIIIRICLIVMLAINLPNAFIKMNKFK